MDNREPILDTDGTPFFATASISAVTLLPVCDFSGAFNIRRFLDITFFLKNHTSVLALLTSVSAKHYTLLKIISSVFLPLSLQGVSYSTFPLVICRTMQQYQTEFPNIEFSCSFEFVMSGGTLGKSERVEGQKSLRTTGC
jgi:hypothetical protein